MSHAMPPADGVQPPPPPARRLIHAVVALALAASVPAWPPVVVGQRVVPPLVAFLGLATVTTSCLRRSRASRGRVAVVTIAVILLVPVLLLLAFDQVTTRRLVLPQHGAHGCRAVAVEDAFLMGANGTVAVIEAPVGFARREGRYWADDGGRPFSFHDYELEWKGRTGVLTLSNGGGPIRPDTMQLHC